MAGDGGEPVSNSGLNSLGQNRYLHQIRVAVLHLSFTRHLGPVAVMQPVKFYCYRGSYRRRHSFRHSHFIAHPYQSSAFLQKSAFRIYHVSRGGQPMFEEHVNLYDARYWSGRLQQGDEKPLLHNVRGTFNIER